MPNEISSIDQYHKCRAFVLNLLYNYFPNSININTNYIEGRDVPEEKRALLNFDDEMKSWGDPGNTSQSNPIKSEIMVYQKTIFHLRDEGYIQSKEPEHGKLQKTFFECKLTSKGLAEVDRLRKCEISESDSEIFARELENEFNMMPDNIKEEWSEKLAKDKVRIYEYVTALKKAGKKNIEIYNILFFI